MTRVATRDSNKMLILKYFKPVCKKEKGFTLPDPSGPLSEGVPSSSIEAANNKVSELIANPLESASWSKSEIYPSQLKTKRQQYLILTPAKRYEIGKRAAENDIAASIRYYAQKYPELPLNKTTVRRVKNLYRLPLSTPSKSQGDSGNSCKKTGRPMLLGEELDTQVQEYVKHLVHQLTHKSLLLQHKA